MTPEGVVLPDSLGKILAENLVAPIDLPRFDNSAMDGFAIRAVETRSASSAHPVQFTIAMELEAGESWEGALRPTEAVRISTGAAVPEACDAVIAAERVAESGGSFLVTEPIEAGKNIRLAGEDIRSGHVALDAGTLLSAREIGLLAALGVESIPVVPAPSVSVLSIGPELFPGARPVPVHDANGPMLAAQARSAGSEIARVECCDGTLDELVALLASLGEISNLIVTSGGVSDSSADTMAELLDSHPNGELWNVRLRPGKHLGIAFLGDHAILALPGNPIAAFVGFELFGRPAIDVLAGRHSDRSAFRARAWQPVTGMRGRTDAIRGRVWHDAGGQLWASPTQNRGSGAIATLPEANCLIILPEAIDSVEAGESVEIRWVGYQ